VASHAINNRADLSPALPIIVLIQGATKLTLSIAKQVEWSNADLQIVSKIKRFKQIHIKTSNSSVTLHFAELTKHRSLR
jgi:hypothetical protein